MEVKLLPEEINERIRSDNKINNFCQCILELIFNSLDAKATSVAIRINTEKHQVQIIDNGNGITLSDLQNVGVRYMTSKCDSLYIYENKHKYYGYRGEALASIVSASQKLIISTRHIEGEFTYTKTFENGTFDSIVPAKVRSSRGTTVIIIGFFFNCPVKQKRIKNSIDLNNIKITLKALAVIHPMVSFSLRDDNTGKILLNCFKTKTVSKSLCTLYGDIASEDLIEVKVSKNNIHVSGLIYTKSYKNTKPQLVYVNKRPANVEKIEKHVNEVLSKTLKDVVAIESYPVFIINISCPYSHIDILFDSFKIVVEFKSWEIVTKCVDKILKLFISKYIKIQAETIDLQANISNNTSNLKICGDTQKLTCKSKIEQDDNMDGNKTLNLKLRDPRTNKIQKKFKSSLLQKSYRKTLGLKKSQMKLKRKKCDNIFERSTNISELSLSFHDFPSNMPLNKEKLKDNPNFFKTIFDEQFDSQHLAFGRTNPINENVISKESQNVGFSQKRNFQSTDKDAILNDESSGKEFVMDLFLNSLTPHIQENILHKDLDKQERLVKEVKPQKLEKSLEFLHDDNISENTKPYLSNLSENNIKPHNEDEISFHTETIRKRRMEKLNCAGTSLINTKLLKLKRSSSDTKTMHSALNNKINRSISTSISEGAIILKRHKSEDKFTQTNFVRDDVNMVSAGVQTSFYMSSSSKHNKTNAENQYDVLMHVPTTEKRHYYRRSDKDKVQNLKSLFTLTDENCLSKLLQSQKNADASNEYKSSGSYFANFKNDKMCSTFNNVTFASHYCPKLVGKYPKNRNSTVIQIDTEDAIASLNNSFSKRIRKQEVKENYENFAKGLENSILNINIHPLDDSFNVNFLNVPNKIENHKNISNFLMNNPKINGKKKAHFSVLIDTSTFFHRDAEKGINPENQSDYFKRPESSQNIKKELYNQTALSFRKFIPAFKSTQKKEKYRGKVYNFFESFMFNEYDEKENINVESNEDITFAPISCEDNTASEKEWIQEVDNIGKNYFVNKRTGMVTYTLCKQPNFLFKKRVDFIPKGLSPILKEINTINVSLSPSGKKKLNNAIIESYESELDLIKWQDYIDKEDPKHFFNNLYEEKRKNIEQIIPSIRDVPLVNIKKVYSSHHNYSFTKAVFKELDILGQLDNKFIVTLSNSTLILLLDQHAVHERIRVEALLQDFTNQNINNDRITFKSVECNESLSIEYTNIELELLDTFKVHFENIGLHFDIFADYVKIKRIPVCFARKSSNNARSEDNLYRLVSILINDELSILQSTRGIPANIPKIIQYSINSQACRGAVKFGQKLTRGECINYIANLAKCQLPFQCAHGRPTVHPILELCNSRRDFKCNLKTLLKLN